MYKIKKIKKACKSILRTSKNKNYLFDRLHSIAVKDRLHPLALLGCDIPEDDGLVWRAHHGQPVLVHNSAQCALQHHPGFRAVDHPTVLDVNLVGRAGQGEARQGEAGQGKARQGEARRGEARRGSRARQGRKSHAKGGTKKMNAASPEWKYSSKAAFESVCY